MGFVPFPAADREGWTATGGAVWRWTDGREWLLLAVSLLGLATGGGLHLAGLARAGDLVWGAVTLLVLLRSLVGSARGLLRGETGVDLIAVLAMAGALLLGQFLAGAIIALMLTGGSSLERYAVSRARRSLAALLERAPREAHRLEGDRVETVDVARVVAGDRLLVKAGEVVPVDGILVGPQALLDESALTGESRLVDLAPNQRIRSGGTNAGGVIEIRATAPASESTYAGIIRLVEEAERSKAPFVRLADRYALGFVFVTLALAGGSWALSGDAIRALAVLVVATPCPLILAAPAAIIAGVSRAARHGIVVKGGGPLEAMSRISILLLDKTGTVTTGRPVVKEVETLGGRSSDELVRLAASLEQASTHPFAPAILDEARDRRLDLRLPSEVREEPGKGIAGMVDGAWVKVGQADWIAPDKGGGAIRSLELRAEIEGASNVYVGVGDLIEGALILHDPIRVEAPRILRELRSDGFRHIHMVTGDHPDVAELVGDAVGIDRVFAERAPDEKVMVVRRVRREGAVAMVGDGINDAPALALADVGIAMGARGATAASEAADMVLTSDRLEGLLHARRIARRTTAIAWQSVSVGMGLSVLAMIFASFGRLTPVAGALLQEGIDILVIVNALRALGGPRLGPAPEAAHRALAGKLADAHRRLSTRVEELAVLAGVIDQLAPADAKRELERTRRMLEDELLPHEAEEQREAYPVIEEVLEEDPTGPLIATHHEIQRLARLFGRLVDRLPEEGPGADDLRDLRRVLYGLHAVLVLHFAQEEEFYAILEE